MRDGGIRLTWCLHSGLTYTPGMYAATSELAVLCKMRAEEYPGAYYAPHHRGYGVNALGNYDEMLQLGRVTGCPVRESTPLVLARLIRHGGAVADAPLPQTSHMRHSTFPRTRVKRPPCCR